MIAQRLGKITQETSLCTVVGGKIYEKGTFNIKPNVDRSTVCIIGLGYVGLPLAKVLAKSLRVIGFDIKGDKIVDLNHNNNTRNLIFYQ